MHLKNKVKEYKDQSDREEHFGQTGKAAQAKGETMAAAATNITKGK